MFVWKEFNKRQDFNNYMGENAFVVREKIGKLHIIRQPINIEFNAVKIKNIPLNRK